MSKRTPQKEAIPTTKVLRSQLVEALGLLKPGLASKDIIDGATSFHFHDGMICSNNDMVSVAVPLKVGVTGSIKADDFLRLLEKIPNEDLTLGYGPNKITIEETGEEVPSEIIVRAGKIKAGLRIKPEVLHPPQPESEFLPLPNGFLEAVHFTMFSCSRNMTIPHLTCVHIQGKKISSADNWRVTQFLLEDPSPLDLLLPADQAQHLSRYNLTHIALDPPSWVHFKNEETGLIVSIRLKAGQFIDVDKFFDVKGQTVVFPPGIKDTLERIRIMTEGLSELDLKIFLHLNENSLLCRGEKSLGWVEETLEIDYDGPEVKMHINPIFLQDILSRTQEMILGGPGDRRVCYFWGKNFHHVMMQSA